ncbi:hypothetical protein LTR10_008623 [Elasticomyces elasticus]|nr:hypothetical protein LTR10_008623 [Elasticomyces elasticus]KAK4967493.1 hypothetical protein LTR42_010842 [Elasticomyces elasticus]
MPPTQQSFADRHRAFNLIQGYRNQAIVMRKIEDQFNDRRRKIEQLEGLRPPNTTVPNKSDLESAWHARATLDDANAETARTHERVRQSGGQIATYLEGLREKATTNTPNSDAPMPEIVQARGLCRMFISKTWDHFDESEFNGVTDELQSRTVVKTVLAALEVPADEHRARQMREMLSESSPYSQGQGKWTAFEVYECLVKAQTARAQAETAHKTTTNELSKLKKDMDILTNNRAEAWTKYGKIQTEFQNLREQFDTLRTAPIQPNAEKMEEIILQRIAAEQAETDEHLMAQLEANDAEWRAKMEDAVQALRTEKDAEIERIQTQLNSTNTENRELKLAVETAQNTVRSTQMTNERDVRIQELEKQIGGKTVSINAQQLEMERCQLAELAAKNNLSLVSKALQEAQIGNANLDGQIKLLQQDLDTAQSNVQRLSQDVATLDANHKDALLKLESANDKIESLGTELETRRDLRTDSQVADALRILIPLAGVDMVDDTQINQFIEHLSNIMLHDPIPAYESPKMLPSGLDWQFSMFTKSEAIESCEDGYLARSLWVHACLPNFELQTMLCLLERAVQYFAEPAAEFGPLDGVIIQWLAIQIASRMKHESAAPPDFDLRGTLVIMRAIELVLRVQHRFALAKVDLLTSSHKAVRGIHERLESNDTLTKQLQLWAQRMLVAGKCGRGKDPLARILQSPDPEHPPLRSKWDARVLTTSNGLVLVINRSANRITGYKSRELKIQRGLISTITFLADRAGVVEPPFKFGFDWEALKWIERVFESV